MKLGHIEGPTFSSTSLDDFEGGKMMVDVKKKMSRACAPFIMIPHGARGGGGSMLIKYETNMWCVYGSLYRGRGAVFILGIES